MMGAQDDARAEPLAVKARPVEQQGRELGARDQHAAEDRAGYLRAGEVEVLQAGRTRLEQLLELER